MDLRFRLNREESKDRRKCYIGKKKIEETDLESR